MKLIAFLFIFFISGCLPNNLNEKIISQLELQARKEKFPYAYLYNQAMIYQSKNKHEIAYELFKKALFKIDGTVPWQLGVYYVDPQNKRYNPEEGQNFFEYYFIFHLASNVPEAPTQCEDNLRQVYRGLEEYPIVTEQYQKVLKLCDQSRDDLFERAQKLYHHPRHKYDPHNAFKIMGSIWYRDPEIYDEDNEKNIRLFHQKLKHELGYKFER